MGRDLHEFLEVQSRYREWIPRMIEYGFEEGKDYTPKNRRVQDSLGREREATDHIITLDMAKEISMIQRTEKGKQARQYFIECERRLKQVQPELNSFPWSKPDLNIRLKPIIVVVSFYKDLNQARVIRGKLGQCIEPRSRSRRPRGFV